MTASDQLAYTPGPSSFAGLQVPPALLPEYGHIKRFYDPRLKAVSAKILPGEFYVTSADELVTTLLGSCVAACIWDPIARIGGMNHFMIPHAGPASSRADVSSTGEARYGLFAMEFLINSILNNGGERHRLQAKLTGGGRVVQGETSIGTENVAFARQYLTDENIPLISEHVEGDHARRVAFHPVTGRCRIQELETWTAEVSESERRYATSIEQTSGPGDIELF